MDPILDHPEIERAFVPWRLTLGDAYAAVHGHVYRQFNYALYLIEARDGREQAEPYGGWEGIVNRVAVAAAFHDVGVFADRTMDYLEPSILRMKIWLERKGHAEWFPEAALMARMHHKLTPYRGEHALLVEPFRQADLTDLTFGLIRNGVPKAFIREMVGHFPYAGFQTTITKRLLAYGLRHPIRPLPMMRL